MTNPITPTLADRNQRRAILKLIIEAMDRPCSEGDRIEDRQDKLDELIARHAQQARDELKATHDRRVSELLEANNREVERRREAERKLRTARGEALEDAKNVALEPDGNSPLEKIIRRNIARKIKALKEQQ